MEDGMIINGCIYTPHSLRATTATPLGDAGVEITDRYFSHMDVRHIYQLERLSHRSIP
jgi:hypothetical protein